MRRSNKLLAVSLAVSLLAGCGMIRKQPDGTPETIGVPTPGKPTAPAKPGDKLVRPVEKGDPQVRFNEALAMFKANQIEEAELSFGWITQDFPQYAGPWTNLGIIYAKSNRNALAIPAFVKAVGLNDDDATAFNWLGILYRQARDYARAESAYKAALRADSGLALAHLNLGILYDEYLKRPADALPHYKNYLRLGGKDDLRVQAWVAQIENPNPGVKPVSPVNSAEKQP